MTYNPNYDPRKENRLKNISNTEFLANAKKFSANYRDVLNILEYNRNEIFLPRINKIIEEISNTNRLEMTVEKRDKVNNLMWNGYNGFVGYLTVEKELLTFLQKPTVLPKYNSK